MSIDASARPASDYTQLDELLSADSLSALMRSTWTWDDRALRRDLATILVESSAATLVTNQYSVADLLHARVRASGSEFVAAVLGTRLIADGGNPLRAAYLAIGTDPATPGRHARAASRCVAERASEYLTDQLDGVEYLPETSWPAAASEGRTEINAAMRSCGHQRGGSALFASGVLAHEALSLANTDVAAAYLRALESGELSATLAAAEESGSWDPALVRVRATATDDGWTLNGTKTYVLDADSATTIFVIGRSTAGPSLYVVSADSPGLTVTAHPVSDSTRPLFAVTLKDTPATLVSADGAGGRLMSQLLDRATTALAAEQVGLIEAALGVLRAHGTAGDPLVVEAVVDHAAALALWQNAVSNPSPEAAATAHIACSAAAVRVTTTAGILTGSDEAAALGQRALSASLFFGGPALSHERLLERLGI